MLVKLTNVRLAFPQLFEPRTVNGEGEPAYSASFIFDKKHPAVKDIEAAIVAVAKEKWGDKAAVILKDLKAKDKTALHDGDLKADYDGYAGNMFISARSKKRPQVKDRDTSPLTAADGKPYGGCQVIGFVDIWPMDNQFGKRISASLLGVQFYKDGEPFSGGATVKDEDFEVIADDDGEGLV